MPPLLFCGRSAVDNHLTWWPLAAYAVYLLLLILPSIMHFCAWLIMTTRTTLDFVCCFAIKQQQSCERSWPPAHGLSISMLVQLCFPSFLPSSIILFPFAFFFFSPSTIPEVWGKWKEGVEQKKKRKKRDLRYSTGDCGNPLIKACILIHPKACLTVYYELLCDH